MRVKRGGEKKARIFCKRGKWKIYIKLELAGLPKQARIERKERRKAPAAAVDSHADEQGLAGARLVATAAVSSEAQKVSGALTLAEEQEQKRGQQLAAPHALEPGPLAEAAAGAVAGDGADATHSDSDGVFARHLSCRLAAAGLASCWPARRQGG